jgi:hypothetical protein
MYAPPQLARLAGLLYLILAICGGFSELFVRASIRADPSAGVSATADNIRASASLFRLGLMTDLLNVTLFVLLAFVLYVLLSPVNRRIAATFVVFVAITSAIMSANLINHAAALILATDTSYAAALGAPVADALARLFLDLHAQGYLIAQIFFGLWLLPLGYLVYVSGFFPRVLGVLLALGCFGYLAGVVVAYAAPGIGSSLPTAFGLIAGVGEISFLLWLLVKGARAEAQTNQVPRAHTASATRSPSALPASTSARK